MNTISARNTPAQDAAYNEGIQKDTPVRENLKFTQVYEVLQYESEDLDKVEDFLDRMEVVLLGNVVNSNTPTGVKVGDGGMINAFYNRAIQNREKVRSVQDRLNYLLNQLE